MQRKVLVAPGFPDMCVFVFVFCISVFVFVAVIVLLTMACAAPWLPPEPQALVAAGHRKCRPALSPLLPLAQLTSSPDFTQTCAYISTGATFTHHDFTDMQLISDITNHL